MRTSLVQRISVQISVILCMGYWIKTTFTVSLSPTVHFWMTLRKWSTSFRYVHLWQIGFKGCPTDYRFTVWSRGVTILQVHSSVHSSFFDDLHSVLCPNVACRSSNWTPPVELLSHTKEISQWCCSLRTELELDVFWSSLASHSKGFFGCNWQVGRLWYCTGVIVVS